MNRSADAPGGRVRSPGARTASAVCAALALVLVTTGGKSASVAPVVNTGIVDVSTKLGYENATSAGTGIVLSPSGEVLTNDHVIRGATTVRVTDVGTGRSYSATVLGYDSVADVAVLELERAPELPAAAIGSSARVTVRQRVTAIGNAGGAGGAPTATSGRVTALNRSITVNDEDGGLRRLSGLIETDVALEPGDSGGPLVDSAGRVIGINTASSGGSLRRPGVSQGYAIPIDRALRIATQIEAGRSTPAVHVGPTPFLGVGVASADDYPQVAFTAGALVADVVAGSPADRAGLTEGDVITSIDGRTVSGPAALTKLLLARGSVGASVLVGWVDRYGAEHRAKARLVSGPPH
jgi:S1-C subfamily serine protease